MFEIGNKLKSVKVNGNLFIPNDIDDSRSDMFGLTPLWVYPNDKVSVVDTTVAFNRDLSEWQSFVIIGTDHGEAAIEVSLAEKLFTVVGSTFNDVDDFKEVNKGPNKDVAETPNPPKNDDEKDLLEFLAKKYGFDLAKEKKALDDDKKLEGYIADLVGLAKNVNLIESDCNKCIDDKDEPCIYNTICNAIRDESDLKFITCSTLRHIDTLVNSRDLTSNRPTNENE